METVERQFSELLRNLNEVVAELDKHDVLLKRPGAASLHLNLAARDQGCAEAVLILAHRLRVIAIQAPESIAHALTDGFPWAACLPEPDRRAFSAELTQALVASADLGSFDEIRQLLREWRATAAIHADPELAASLLKPITDVDGRPVAKP